MLKTGWSIEAWHLRIAHVEVDFLARDPTGLLHIIEVKSEGSLHHGVVSERQLERLQRVAGVLAEREPVELLVLVVQAGGQILPIPI